MFNRVLIMSASAGNGHVRAAEALEKTFVAAGAARQVLHIDALTYASPLVRRLYSNTYIEMVNKSPALLGILYDAADKPWWAENRRLAFHRLNTWPLIKYIESYDPDLIISTHPLPADIVSFLICKGRLRSRHAVVVTDFDIHGMWFTRHCDHYFTAMDETREHLIRIGAAPAKVAVTGIPIEPSFSNLPKKGDSRRALGLAPDKVTVMVSAGGFGVGRISELLAHLVEIDQPAQILAMCGKNSELKAALEETYRRSNARSRVDVVPVGYVRNMHEYMAACDLMVGKPGGLTTAEALASGLVMVIVNPIPGQEERNADHLLEEGAAIRCNNLPALTYKLNKLLSNPQRFAEMQKNVQRLSKPAAAADIIALLLSQQEVYAQSSSPEPDSFASPHHCTTRLQRMVRARRISPVTLQRDMDLFGKSSREAG